MEYNLKCRYCGKKTQYLLKGFDEKKEQKFKIPCVYCKKINIKTFPDEYKLEEFYKSLKERERLYFQKYFLEMKSLREIAKELNTSKSTIEQILTKRFKLRSIKKAMKIYCNQ